VTVQIILYDISKLPYPDFGYGHEFFGPVEQLSWDLETGFTSASRIGGQLSAYLHLVRLLGCNPIP